MENTRVQAWNEDSTLTNVTDILRHYFIDQASCPLAACTVVYNKSTMIYNDVTVYIRFVSPSTTTSYMEPKMFSVDGT